MRTIIPKAIDCEEAMGIVDYLTKKRKTSGEKSFSPQRSQVDPPYGKVKLILYIGEEGDIVN